MTDTATAVRMEPPPRAPRPGAVLAAIGPRGSAAVLRAAELLAARLGTSVHVLGVVEPLPMYFDPGEAPLMIPDVPRDDLAELETRLGEEADDALGARVPWTVGVEYGDVARTIVEAARAIAAPVIVVGIGRHRPVDRLLGRETTLHVTQLADRPVLAVVDSFTELPTSIVAATDFSTSSAHAVEAAVPLLGDPATLSLLHVWERPANAAPLHDGDEARVERALAPDFEHLRHGLSIPPRIAVQDVVLEGPTVATILDYARGQGASIVAVGRRGHSWLDRLLVGSIATALLRGARCSVLVSPEPRGVQAPPLAAWEKAAAAASVL